VTAPRVSVLLPVHDGAETIAAAVRSILDQTWDDLELLVTDDASTDATAEVLAGFDDPRLVVHRNPVNLHRSRSLNDALDRARGELIARMDADDVSRPGRLAAQVAYLDAHPDVGICGTWIRTFGHTKGAVWRLPTDPDELKARLLFRSALAHPTVVMRVSSLRAAGLRYRDDQRWSEDWDLWQRAADHFPLGNVPEVYLDYRSAAPADLHAPDMADRLREANGIVADNLRRLGLDPTDEEVDLHRRIGAHEVDGWRDEVERAEAWLQNLLDANDVAGRYPEPAFRRVVGEHWFFTCYTQAGLGPWVVRRLRRSTLALHVEVGAARWAKLGVRLLQRRAR
jgi:glycosyltransferase involved in cell wall biosynthesis